MKRVLKLNYPILHAIKDVHLRDQLRITLRCVSKMARWDQDVAYALASYKTLAWPLGAWPIDDDPFYSKIRWSFAMISEVRKFIAYIFL